jgi:O-antigen ligase
VDWQAVNRYEAATGLPATAAQRVAAVLPLALFLPQAFTYFGLLAFIIVLLASGNFSGKLAQVRQNPMCYPVMVLLAISIVAGLLLERPAGEFWPGFGHYQTYLFLLLLVAAGAGPWQAQAVRFFYAGATVAATLFYAKNMGLLPNWGFLRSYAVYGGNKSILLGILLAVAAGWMLHDLVSSQQRRWLAILRLLYVAVAAVALAKTRTGLLIFLVLCLYVLFKSIRSVWHRVVVAALLVVVAGVGMQVVPGVGKRIAGTVEDARNFMQGKEISKDGVRLDMFRVTLEIIKEKPVTGHGIGTWLQRYTNKVEFTEIEKHTTPHNDYLLYLSEIGIVGLAGLLLIWATQFVAAARLGGDMGAKLTMLTIALLIGAMFNAILRDAVFGLAFMILLAIPLAGARRRSQPLPANTQ